MIYSLDLDITPNGVPQIVKLSQYDKTMPTLAITLYNGSQVFTIPTGCTAYIEGTKADKTGFQYPCTVSGGVINATITEQMTAFAGRVPCEIVLRKSGERKGSANFFLDVEPSALSDDTVISDSDLPIIQQMPEYAQSCADDAELAHKWATFGSDSETPSATNNAKYWAEQAEAVTGVGDLMTTRSKLGAKNLLPNTAKTPSSAINGITFVVNADGSIRASGTASADTYFYTTQDKFDITNGRYVVSGCPSGGSTTSYALIIGLYNGTTWAGNPYETGNGYNLNIGTDWNVNKAQVGIMIKSGTAISTPITFYPMIRLATDHDSTYQPYAMTNRELTEFAINKMGKQLPLVNLGTEYTAELKADISSGKFEKAVVGGYLTINGHVYYFAHPDYWLHTGDTECTTHHMLVIPAGNIGTGKMNDTNITTGAYAGSDMKTGNNSNTALATAAAQIKADFGASNILTHRELFANAVTDGKASGWAWADSDIDLMNEVMVYGCNVLASAPGYETGIDKCQLKLFQERPDLITTRANWWLRSVVSATHFAHVTYYGFASYGNASNVDGVRPAFAIKG